MLGISTFAALLPALQAEWGLDNSQAGWIHGIYYAGYLFAVPVLVSLTDRVDPRRMIVSPRVADVRRPVFWRWLGPSAPGPSRQARTSLSFLKLEAAWATVISG